MKTTIEKEFGKLTYEENFWTGKKKVILNGQNLEKIDKTTFQYVDAEGKIKNVFLTGNFISGVKVNIEGQYLQLTPSATWYEYVLAIAGFIIVLVWGNSPELCSIIPIVGGAIGGGISGFLGFSSLIIMKSTNNPLFKVLIGLGMVLTTMIVCCIVGFLIIMAMI